MSISDFGKYPMTGSRRTVQMTDMDWSQNSRLDPPVYQTFPPNQPFMFDEYRREPNRPVKAYPESNRKEIVMALKNLQDKMRRLELEKTQQRFIDAEGSNSRPFLSATQPNGRVQTAEKSLMTDGIHLKLDRAEERCQLLEKQLNEMRTTVHQAELDRSEAFRKSALLRENHSSPSGSSHQGGQAGKVLELEREQLRLMAMQTLAASQIQELEEKLHTERHYRKLMQNKAAELESAAAANRILIESDRVNKQPKKKKRATSAGKTPSSVRHPSVRRKVPAAGKKATSEHYRLNLAEIPFINGKSTGKSYSLSANFQEVLSLMKSHTPRLCRASSCGSRPRRKRSDDDENRCHGRNVDYDDDGGDEVETGSVNQPRVGGLASLLVQLQDEFGHMAFEHKELLSQIQEATDEKSREDLERELDCLVLRMETKSDQITRLRRYQESLGKKKRRGSKPRTPTTRPSSSAPHTTTSAKSVPNRSQNKPRPTSSCESPGASKAQGSLHLLKDLKRIQASLREDDIVWD